MSPKAEPFSRTAAWVAAGMATVAAALGGMVVESEKVLARRDQDKDTCPAMVGMEPLARLSPLRGGLMAMRTPPSAVGGNSVRPSSDSLMATSADEPQPWLMESPTRSLGAQVSQV